MNTTNKLSLEVILETIRFSKEAQQMLEHLKDESDSPKCTSLHAVYLIQSLFSEGSSDKANVDRITLNLESAAADLLSISHLIKNLL
jgi:hypothetical protein